MTAEERASQRAANAAYAAARARNQAAAQTALNSPASGDYRARAAAVGQAQARVTDARARLSDAHDALRAAEQRVARAGGIFNTPGTLRARSRAARAVQDAQAAYDEAVQRLQEV